MFRTPVLMVAAVVALFSLATFRLDASDGILSRIHRHQSCDAKQTVVRLPAQEIRIETTQPRVVVNQAAPFNRGRMAFQGTRAFAPVLQGPFVATFVPMTMNTGNPFGFSSAPSTSGGNALHALHQLEAQAAEVNRQRAAYKADMDNLEKVQRRIQAGFSSFSPGPTTSASELSELKTSIDNLTKRVSDIERLLIIHDNILKANPPKK